MTTSCIHKNLCTPSSITLRPKLLVGRIKPGAQRPAACHAAKHVCESPDASGCGMHHRIAVALASTVIVCSNVLPASALGLESVELPGSIETPDFLANMSKVSREKQAEVDTNFQNSESLKKLLEKSKENQAKNKRDIQNKYCYR